MADLSVINFIEECLEEATTATGTVFETRQGTAFYDLFIQPQEFMLQPFTTALNNILIDQSVSLILAQTDPDSWDPSAVDDLMANLYVDRYPGAYATGPVNVYYNAPVAREWPAFSVQFTGQDGNVYFNNEDFSITTAEMAQNTSGSYFYLSTTIQAQGPGTAYNADVNEITAVVNDSDAVLVQNPGEIEGGLDQETNTEVLARAPTAIAVRDLETNKGISAIIQQNFPYITALQAIGMGDPEMQRDIFYNIHTGGYTDVYTQSPPPLTEYSSSFFNLEYDTTRNLSLGFNKQISATSFTQPAAAVGVVSLVQGSVTVTTDIIPTSAMIVSSVIPPQGWDFTNAEYIQLLVDGYGAINIKISGAIVSQTQLYEVINAINNAFEPLTGINVATTYGANQLSVTSTLVGITSILQLLPPTSPRTDGTLILFPSATAHGYEPGHPGAPAEYQGDYPYTYVEDVDYEVNYSEGLIIKLPNSAIPTGSTIAGPATNGGITEGSNLFTCSLSNIFGSVEIGDLLEITASTGVPVGQYIVSSIVNDNTLQILDFNPTASDENVSFSVVSNQTQVISLEYNPLSIDIGNLVVLSDGVTRGIRPGRADYTITTLAFLSIVSIEQIDPNTGLGLGVYLNAPGGYGTGGYGQGPYGQGTGPYSSTGGGGDYVFIVNVPPARFSAFEDALIAINQEYFGNSYQVNFYAQPNIVSLHTFCRTDGERVTGADVLPKNFVPCLVNIPNLLVSLPTGSTLTMAALETALEGYINGITPSQGQLDAGGIVDFLITQGVANVQIPFVLTGYIQNTDGSTTIVSSQNALTVPNRTLPSQTSNYVTPRITQFYANDITISEYTTLITDEIPTPDST